MKLRLGLQSTREDRPAVHGATAGGQLLMGWPGVRSPGRSCVPSSFGNR
jgi:hypothetical protein